MMANYQVSEIAKNFWKIEEEQVRCFLFAGTERALLIDSGKDIDNLRGIVEGLTQLPIMLINTHTDFDHTCCNAQFEEVYMHPAEYSFYHQAQTRTSGLKPLWDGDIIDLGDRTFEVILLPGHTPGSIALLDSEHRILIGGDSVQDGTIYLFGPQRDLTAYIHSLERLLAISHRFDKVFPSHAQCPIDAKILPDLIEGAKKLLAGELRGEQFFPDNLSVKVYDMGVARILYEH